MKSYSELKKLVDDNWYKSEDLTSQKYDFEDIDQKQERVSMHNDMKKSEFYNKFHLSPGNGLLNDPNGLVDTGKIKHIFYQWSPIKPAHLLKHWGHYETSNFIDYKFTGIAIKPSLKEEENGAFSGGGIEEDGQVYLFWTGNIHPFGNDDLDRSSFTLMGKWDENTKKVIDKKPLFEVDKNKYTGHFRDPIPFKLNGKYYLVHGARLKNNKGALVLYESENIWGPYKHLGKLNFSKEITSNAYMFECPDFFIKNGKKYLIYSPQGERFYGEDQNRDVPILVEIDMDIPKMLITPKGQTNIIDHGYDFYAPQTMKMKDGRIILLGWGGISDTNPYPTIKQGWAHNLTIPRELNFDDGKLLQTPISEYKNLLSDAIPVSETIDLKKRQIMFSTNNIQGSEFEIKLFNEADEQIKIHSNGNEIIFDKSLGSFPQAPEYGEKRKRKLKVEDLLIFLDSSYIEIFINKGTFCFSMKYWLTGNIKMKISRNLIKNTKLNYLKPINIDWGGYYE